MDDPETPKESQLAETINDNNNGHAKERGRESDEASESKVGSVVLVGLGRGVIG